MQTPGHHWYCLQCHRPTELNMDREVNVCGHCGSMHVKRVPNKQEPLSRDRLLELTQGMRRAVEGDSESTNSE